MKEEPYSQGPVLHHRLCMLENKTLLQYIMYKVCFIISYFKFFQTFIVFFFQTSFADTRKSKSENSNVLIIHKQSFQPKINL